MELRRRWSSLELSLWITCILIITESCSGAYVGVSFGSAVSNLPRPERVVDLLRSMGVSHVRLYDSTSDILTAFAGSGIELLVGVPNNAVQSLGSSRATAENWVKNNIVPFLPNTNITGIVIGNEVLTSFPTAAHSLLPAMKYVHQALITFKIARQVLVTSAHSSKIILGAFPPSHAFFDPSSGDGVVLKPMLDFLAHTGSFFMLNMNPLAIYQETKPATPLEYVLFKPNKGALDSNTGLNYSNLFDAVVDAAFSAMSAMNHSSIPVVVGEAGWPWRGDNTPEASVENAEVFNRNLVEHVVTNKASPMRPGSEVNTYIHELYNEDKKTGVASERFWGLFNANQTPVYRLDVSGVTLKAGSSGNSSVVRTWCVAKPGIGDKVLESALDWACGAGAADCSAIQQGGACYMPNSVASHASYAFNSYFQRSVEGNGTCDFNGCAMLTNTDPSYNNCIFSAGSVMNSNASPSQNSTLKSVASPRFGSSSGMSAAAGAFVAIMSASLF